MTVMTDHIRVILTNLIPHLYVLFGGFNPGFNLKLSFENLSFIHDSFLAMKQDSSAGTSTVGDTVSEGQVGRVSCSRQLI